MLLLATLIILALFVICSALIYTNRDLSTDPEVFSTPDFAPENTDSFSFDIQDEGWGTEYLLANGYSNKKKGQYKVHIKQPFASNIVSMDSLVTMGNGADVIFTENQNLLIEKTSNKKSSQTIIQEELQKYCARQLLPNSHLCKEITLKEICEISHHKILLNQGLPIRIGRMTILSNKTVYGEEAVYPRSRAKTRLAPKHVANKMPGTKSKIPKIFHQTFETMIVAERTTTHINAWIQSNPDYEYNYYTGEDCRDFIADNFSSEVLAAYDTLYPGAFKADLWRLCALYKKGGVYCDIKLFPVMPLYKLIDPNVDLVLVKDQAWEGNRVSVFNAFIGVTPNHPLIKRFLDATVRNVLQKRMTHFLDITGPIMLGTEFEKYVKDNGDLYDFEPGIHKISDDVTIQMLELKFNTAIFDWCITRGDTNPVIYRRYKQDGFFGGDKAYALTSGKSHYYDLFKKNQVYEKGIVDEQN